LEGRQRNLLEEKLERRILHVQVAETWEEIRRLIRQLILQKVGSTGVDHRSQGCSTLRHEKQGHHRVQEPDHHDEQTRCLIVLEGSRLFRGVWLDSTS
jgi:hypothetical protein